MTVRGASALAATLAAQREQAMLFRTLATLRLDAPTIAGIDELRWRGPAPEFEAIAGLARPAEPVHAGAGARRAPATRLSRSATAAWSPARSCRRPR